MAKSFTHCIVDSFQMNASYMQWTSMHAMHAIHAMRAMHAFMDSSREDHASGKLLFVFCWRAPALNMDAMIGYYTSGLTRV